MANWRMQLHPNDRKESALYTTASLSAGFVGLGFEVDPGDLMRANRDEIPTQEKRQLAFAHRMKVDDAVLVFVHNFPFALARVAGDYNYIREPVPQIGVWFRHFRAVKDVRYFSDFKTNVKTWEKLTMTETLTPLVKEDTKSQLIIDEWVASLENSA